MATLFTRRSCSVGTSDTHNFADSTLPLFDPDAIELLVEQALGSLTRV